MSDCVPWPEPWRRARRGLVVAMLFACACARPSDERAPANPLTPEQASSTDAPKGGGAARRAAPSRVDSGVAFTTGIVQREAAPQDIALLTDVRYARHDGFDRVVFEFAGDSLPGYHLEYIDEPVRHCGSGEATPVAGDAWLEVRFSPANAHTPSGAPTIAFREKKLDLGVLRELERVCDFEAHVTWVLGATRPNAYRVLTLRAPARLVVDVKR